MKALILSGAFLLTSFFASALDNSNSKVQPYALTAANSSDGGPGDFPRVERKKRAEDPVNYYRKPASTGMGTTAADVEATRQVREAIMSDTGLSSEAQNIQIFTKGKTVTISGPVQSDAEKATVERLAKSVIGNLKVVNNTTVK